MEVKGEQRSNKVNYASWLPNFVRTTALYGCMLLGGQGFFSKFSVGETKIFGPRQSPMGTKPDGGGELAKKIQLKPKLPT